MDYQIAIPSYKRPETIKNKTLKLLMDHNIDKNKIIIFVADNDEEKIYKQSLGNEYRIVVGVHTIGNQRNFIERYYNENTRVVMFDDDLDGVFVKNENNLDPIDNIENDLIINGFNECIKNNSYVLGVYAAANAYFMLNRIYTKLCYIPGGVFGVIIQVKVFV